MPRLQILVHKSYHPYLQSNKDKVAKDEKEQKERDQREELRVLQADSEARLSLLRRRDDPNAAPLDVLLPPSSSTSTTDPFYASEDDRRTKPKRKLREKDDMKELERVLDGKGKGKEREREREREGRGGGGGHDDGKYRTKDGRHLNFWAEEETVGPPKPLAPPPPPLSQEETQKLEPHTMFLSRTERELKPWYVDKELKRFDERGEPKDERERERRERMRRKDLQSKTSRDPLTHISSLLSTSSKPKPIYPPLPPSRPNPMPPPTSTTSSSSLSARLARESSERARAQALLASASASRRHGSASSSSTPTVSSGSTVGGRTPMGYEERRFYPEEVRRAREGREHGRGKGLGEVRWEDDRSSRHGSGSRRSSGGGSERGSGYGGRYREV